MLKNKGVVKTILSKVNDRIWKAEELVRRCQDAEHAEDEQAMQKTDAQSDILTRRLNRSIKLLVTCLMALNN